jgi:hypothetical protein
MLVAVHRGFQGYFAVLNEVEPVGDIALSENPLALLKVPLHRMVSELLHLVRA